MDSTRLAILGPSNHNNTDAKRARGYFTTICKLLKLIKSTTGNFACFSNRHCGRYLYGMCD